MEYHITIGMVPLNSTPLRIQPSGISVPEAIA
jgi:hypothetical protein